MNTGKQCKRKVVTKREYAAHQGKKVGYTFGMAALFFLFMITGALTLVSALRLYNMLQHHGGATNLQNKVSLTVLTMGCGLWCTTLLKKIARMNTSLMAMEPVAPLTRHNTGDLPENESLVRASKEPTSLQSKVLLRAAQGGEEKHQEQLLRPVDE